MAQAIVCSSREGLILATDSLVLRELEGGQVERLTVRQLYPLGPRAAILSRGEAEIGLDLAVLLSEWLAPRQLQDLGDILALSRDFLSERYARHLKGLRGSSAGRYPAARHLHYIVGGLAPGASAQAILLHSEAGELPFRELQLGPAFSLPRRAVLEGHLARQIAEGAGVRELAQSCRAALQSAAGRNPEVVGGPFLVAMITAAGLELLGEGTPAQGIDEE